MRVNDLSTVQFYEYKGWSIFLNGKEHTWKHSYTFRVFISFSPEILKSVSKLITRDTNLPSETVEKALTRILPMKFVLYDITIKKKILSMNLLDAPYVQEAINQTNKNIDNQLCDAITFIKNNINKLNQEILSILNK